MDPAPACQNVRGCQFIKQRVVFVTHDVGLRHGISKIDMSPVTSSLPQGKRARQHEDEDGGDGRRKLRCDQ